MTNAADVGGHHRAAGSEGFDERHRGPFVAAGQHHRVKITQNVGQVVAPPHEVDPTGQASRRRFGLELPAELTVSHDGKVDVR